MAGGSSGEGGKKDAAAAVTAVTKKKPRGFISRFFGGIFRIQRRGDVRKRLEMISKEEVVIRNRMKNRSLTRNRYRRQAVFFSILLEMIAVASAIMAREQLMNMDWKTKALRVLPMFLWPALSIVSYSAYWKLIEMRDEKDQKTLKSLRSEKQGILDDLKEKTKFYEIQQMIQKYDSDPAAKAAAAAVLASKLGADSGLKMYLGDNTVLKSNDSELVQSGGLRKRKEPHGRSSSEGSTRMYQESVQGGTQGGLMTVSEHNQLVGEQFDPRGFPPAQDSAWAPGWISQIAAFLVGEDPTQSYAMICSSCLRHNGLVSKEDFHHLKYYCPHCGVLNESKKFGGTSTTATTTTSGSVSITGAANGGSTISSSPKEASNTSASGPSTISSPKDASRNSSGSAAAPESEIVETTEEQDVAADSAAHSAAQ